MKKSIFTVVALLAMFCLSTASAFAQHGGGAHSGGNVRSGAAQGRVGGENRGDQGGSYRGGNYGGGYGGGYRNYGYGYGYGYNLGWYANGYAPSVMSFNASETVYDPSCNCYVNVPYVASWNSYYGGYSYYVGGRMYLRRR
jgi:hypothetical protein